jgi:predicted MFS family arabinose efflux permease
MQTTNVVSAAAAPPHDVPVLLLAASAGLSVAAIYYSQPMLGVVGVDLEASARGMGLVPTLTQLGYAAGILLLAPLGDRFDRRRIILVKAVALVLALLMAAAAPTLGVLLAASLVIGVAATMAQDVVPAAAALASDAHRGRVVGTVMTGLLLGILLSRVVSGLVAEHYGWRAVFVIAAVSVAAIGLACRRALPRFAPATQLPYAALLGSLAHLWRSYPSLRRATLAQGLLALGFSAFWSTLALMLHGEPFHMGSAAAGAFGLAGAAGALAAPLAGRLADRRGPVLVTRLGAGVATVFFAAMALGPLLTTPLHLALLVVCAIGFDLGVHAALIAHQSLVYSLDAGARSRLNSLLVVGMFLCMAAGAALASALLAAWGWMGVTALATGASLAAFGVRMWPQRGPNGSSAL